LGFLRKHLANAGIDAEEIDTVIFSHTHVDHVGGTLGWRARLSKCALLITGAEWTFWIADTVAIGSRMAEGTNNGCRLSR
jgi:metal-dependent hydrolase (beta-lactamase superfamily II)